MLSEKALQWQCSEAFLRSLLTDPQVWDAGSGSVFQRLPSDTPVLDISPFSVNGEHFLASLTEKMLKLYRWESTAADGQWDTLCRAAMWNVSRTEVVEASPPAQRLLLTLPGFPSPSLLTAHSLPVLQPFIMFNVERLCVCFGQRGLWISAPQWLFLFSPTLNWTLSAKNALL